MIKEQKQLIGKYLLEKIQEETFWKNKNTIKYIEAASKAEQDSERKNRLKHKLCKYCYYLRGPILAGAAFTATTCRICNMIMTFSSTHTDNICMNCAKKHKLCKQCLSDIDYKKRRKI